MDRSQLYQIYPLQHNTQTMSIYFIIDVYNYFSDRTQSVLINGFLCDLLCGVPQGSILESITFVSIQIIFEKQVMYHPMRQLPLLKPAWTTVTHYYITSPNCRIFRIVVPLSINKSAKSFLAIITISIFVYFLSVGSKEMSINSILTN